MGGNQYLVEMETEGSPASGSVASTTSSFLYCLVCTLDQLFIYTHPSPCNSMSEDLVIGAWHLTAERTPSTPTIAKLWRFRLTHRNRHNLAMVGVLGVLSAGELGTCVGDEYSCAHELGAPRAKLILAHYLFWRAMCGPHAPNEKCVDAM